METNGKEQSVYKFAPLKEATSVKKNNKYSDWHREITGEVGEQHKAAASYRLKQERLSVNIRPHFTLKKDDMFFAVGSCFARRIEEALHKKQMNVPAFKMMLSERQIFPTLRYINKYNTYSMLYEIEYALGIRSDFSETIFGSEDTGYACAQSVFLAKEDYGTVKFRREKILECFRTLVSSEVIVLTLGLVEVWYDGLKNMYMNSFTPNLMMREPERYSFRVIPMEENLRNLHIIYRHIKEHNKKDFNIIVTVSPVPLLNTFTENDILIANCLSKSILRTTADIFANSYENVHYFPSYEMAVLSERNTIFENDLRHVSTDGAEYIIDNFLKAYLPEA